ncbi:MAG: hypothetical protein WCV92_01675 [Candidatus Buchananbacteria bacterium]
MSISFVKQQTSFKVKLAITLILAVIVSLGLLVIPYFIPTNQNATYTIPPSDCHKMTSPTYTIPRDHNSKTEGACYKGVPGGTTSYCWQSFFSNTETFGECRGRTNGNSTYTFCPDQDCQTGPIQTTKYWCENKNTSNAQCISGVSAPAGTITYTEGSCGGTCAKKYWWCNSPGVCSSGSGVSNGINYYDSEAQCKNSTASVCGNYNYYVCENSSCVGRSKPVLGKINYSNKLSCNIDCSGYNPSKTGFVCSGPNSCATAEVGSTNKLMYGSGDTCVANAAKDCGSTIIIPNTTTTTTVRPTFKCSGSPNYICAQADCTPGAPGCYSSNNCDAKCVAPVLVESKYKCSSSGCAPCLASEACTQTWDTCQSSCNIDNNPKGCCLRSSNWLGKKAYNTLQSECKPTLLFPRTAIFTAGATASGSQCIKGCAEITFSTIRSSLKNGAYTKITENDFKSWAAEDPYDVSGDIAEIREEMGAYQRTDTVVVGQRLVAGGSSAMRQLLTKPKPTIFTYYIINPNGTGGWQAVSAHAVVLISIVDNGGGKYSLRVIDSMPSYPSDPNKPELSTLECRTIPAEGQVDGLTVDALCDVDDYTKALPAIYTYGSAGETNDPVSQLKSARDAYCQSTEGKTNTAFCSRNIGQWLEANYPAIVNSFVQRDAEGGMCIGWSDFILRVAYLGDFTGECPK